MNICLDAFALSHLQNTGLYSYAYELIDNIVNFYPQPHYKLITNKEGSPLSFEGKIGVTVDFIDLNRNKKDFTTLTQYLKDNKVKLFHSLNNGFTIPEDKTCKYVVTIQDVLPLADKNMTDEKYYNNYMSLVPTAINKSDKIIAVSNYVKDIVEANFTIDNDKVEVINPMTSKKFKPIWAVHYKNFLTKQYNISSEYILYVGSIHQRKNLELLFFSFKKVLNIIGNIKLVIVGDIKGKRERYYNELKKVIHDLGIENYVIFLGSISYSDLPYLYNGAQCFINLSMSEGYPLTAIEAMKCQIPVICSRADFFTEILGSYPSYVDSQNCNEISEIMVNVISNKKEIYLKKSWVPDDQEAVRKIIRLYESLIYQ